MTYKTNMNKTNIWILNPYNSPPELGPLIRHYEFGKQLYENGYNPTVFAASYIHNTNIQMVSDSRRYRFYGTTSFPYVFVKTRSYGDGNRFKRILSMLDYYYNLMNIAKDFPNPDIILGSSAHPLAILAAIRLAKRYKTPCIGEVRDLWPESFAAYDIVGSKSPFLGLLYAGEKWLYKKVNALIFTMEGGKDYIVEKGWDTQHGGPIDLKKVFHINNGVDLEEFDYNKEQYSFPDRDLDDPTTFKIVYAGSVRKVNGIENLVEVAELLKTKVPCARILIWGNGDCVENLCERIRESKLDNIAYKGVVDKKRIPSILAKAEANLIQVQQTDIMRFGCSLNKLFEYLAAAKPILSTLQVAYDLIKRHNCGFVCNSQQPQTIADEIVKLYQLSPEERIAMGNAARKAAELYDYKNLAFQLERVLKEDYESLSAETHAAL